MWKPIDADTPRGIEILVCGPKWLVAGVAIIDGVDGEIYSPVDSSTFEPKPTRWMFMPDLPEDR